MMRKVKLEKPYYNSENVTIASDGLTFQTSTGYGFAAASIGVRKDIKIPAYVETKLGPYTGLTLGMRLVGKSENYFEIMFYPLAGVFTKAEIVNGIRTPTNVVNPKFSSGNIVGTKLDPANNKITLFINGTLYSEYSASKLNFSLMTGDNITFYAGVCSYSSSASEFTVNFGATPFAYPMPDGCIPYERAVSYHDKKHLYLIDNNVYGEKS